ncbi:MULTISPECIES: response regulator transcription factor [unclassified Paraburkholderia]|uniref:response regulator transcription factor n=1 Tax=unclassified Paraburkholderia TaxID=2615204 RepID=UPI002AAF1D81|nr:MULTISPECIES: winged helix-turn-helix domain-containing protein [unclassified Paraburkholderia]
MRILFIGSPGPESEWLCKALRESTHSVLWSTTCAAGVRASQDEVFDVVMLIAQSSAPLMGLEEVVGDIRKGSPDAVFALVMKAHSADERAEFFKSGIDVCFSRPWSFVEMHERILALHRTTALAQHGYRNIEPCLKLDAQTRELVNGTARLAVTKREFLVLECLLRNVGVPVKHEQLLRYAWCDEEESDIATIPPLIWRLRRKLQGRLPDVSIVTEQAYGYRLTHHAGPAPLPFRADGTTAAHRAYA